MDKITALLDSLPTGVQEDVSKLTSSVVLTTTVPTTIAQNIETITSVLSSAQSLQDSAFDAITKVKDLVSSASIMNDIIQAQATMNFYSILQNIATETNTESQASLITEAAKASHIMKDLFDDHAYYSGNAPSLGGNLALLIIFSLLMVAMIVSNVFYHQYWFLSCWTAGMVLEILGYIGRIISSQNVMSFDAFVMQLVCLTLAPCFMMAGVYYVIAQLSLIYGEHFSVLRPMQYSLIFIICDLISIFLQAIGGAVASAAVGQYKSADSGSHIMVAGLAFQVLTIGGFQICWYILLYRVYKEYKAHGDTRFNPDFKHIRERKYLVPFIIGVSIAVLLVFIRSIYRLIELAEGWSSDLATKEIYFMILEALMVVINAVILCILTPGLAYGRNSHIYIDKSWKKTFGLKRKQTEAEFDAEFEKNAFDSNIDDERSSA